MLRIFRECFVWLKRREYQWVTDLSSIFLFNVDWIWQTIVQNDIQPKWTIKNRYWNRKSSYSDQQPQYCSLWSENIKHHAHNSQRIASFSSVDLHPISEADWLWQQFSIHQPKTIFNGNTRVHAPWDTKLYFIPKWDGIWYCDAQKNVNLQKSMDNRYMESRVYCTGNSFRYSSVDVCQNKNSRRTAFNWVVRCQKSSIFQNYSKANRSYRQYRSSSQIQCTLFLIENHSGIVLG